MSIPTHNVSKPRLLVVLNPGGEFSAYQSASGQAPSTIDRSSIARDEAVTSEAPASTSEPAAAAINQAQDRGWRRRLGLTPRQKNLAINAAFAATATTVGVLSMRHAVKGFQNPVVTREIVDLPNGLKQATDRDNFNYLGADEIASLLAVGANAVGLTGYGLHNLYACARKYCITSDGAVTPSRRIGYLDKAMLIKGISFSLLGATSAIKIINSLIPASHSRTATYQQGKTAPPPLITSNGSINPAISSYLNSLSVGAASYDFFLGLQTVANAGYALRESIQSSAQFRSQPQVPMWTVERGADPSSSQRIPQAVLVVAEEQPVVSTASEQTAV